MWEIESGKWVGCGDKAGLDWWADVNLPGRCVALMVMSKCAMKSHREHKRCITIVSFEEPLLVATTNPSLSHWKLMRQWCSICPKWHRWIWLEPAPLPWSLYQTIQGATAIGTTWNLELLCIPMYVPEASVWATKSGVVKRMGWHKMLKPFQGYRMCHQNKSDLKALFSLAMKCSFWVLWWLSTFGKQRFCLVWLLW